MQLPCKGYYFNALMSGDLTGLCLYINTKDSSSTYTKIRVIRDIFRIKFFSFWHSLVWHNGNFLALFEIYHFGAQDQLAPKY